MNDFISPVKDVFMHYCDQYFKDMSFQWIRTDIECTNQDNEYDCGILTLGITHCLYLQLNYYFANIFLFP